MVYTKHTWLEYTGTGADKAGWLNNMETQYTEMGTYVDTTYHDSLYYLDAECAKYFSASNQGSGSGFVCEKLDGYTGDQLIAMGVSAYTIAIWSGAIVDIPTGWHICDGRADGYTPDLRDKFVVGAGDAYAVGATGGYATVASTASTVTIGTHALTTDEIPAHSHSGIEDKWNANNPGAGSGAGPSLGANFQDNAATTGTTGSGTAHGHPGSTLTGEGATGNNLPPYKAYAYIIKEP